MPRTPYLPPQHTDGGTTVSFPPRSICFLHPGYVFACQTFLILPAADKGTTLHHETARLACALIAGNRVDGFLSEDREGQRRVVDDAEFALDKEEYYFQVVGEHGLDFEYPITPSFLHWSPPPLPAYWQRCDIPANPPHPMPRATSMQVANRDISCRMTQCKEATETAHIIPASAADWFRSRAMFRSADFDHPSNAILLKSDVHTIWDSKKCTIVPKSSAGASVLVMYVLKRDCSEEIIRLYHDVELQPLYGVRPDFLFARFAWTVFEQSSLKSFLEQGVRRHLRLRSTDGKNEDRWCLPEECRTLTIRARSTSPVKRLRTGTDMTSSEVQQRWTSTESFHSSSSEDTELSTAAADEFWGHEGRGRKRRRTSSCYSSVTHGMNSRPKASSVQDVKNNVHRDLCNKDVDDSESHKV